MLTWPFSQSASLRLAYSFALLVVAALVSGCSSPSRTADPDARAAAPTTTRSTAPARVTDSDTALPLGTTNTEYVRAYRARQFEKALREAAYNAESGPTREREQAALIAGLSAHALNRPMEARNWLTPLTRSLDTGIAGRADATLGVMALERGDNAEAARLLDDASKALKGSDAARAAMYSGDAYAAMNQPGAARDQYQRAKQLAGGNTRLIAMIDERLSTGGPGGSAGSIGGGSGAYSVQFGAFSSRANANAELARVQQRAERANVASTRIATTTDRQGRTLFVVRAGRFTTRAQADQARTRLGSGIVTRDPAER